MGTWITFGTATSPEAMSQLDVQFNNVASGMSIPCSATGSNAISLSPLTGFPSLLSYNQLGGYRFIAANTSSGAVTAQYNGLGFLPVYKADGATQANVGDIIAGEQYIFTYDITLNGGLGGFFMEAPSQPVSTSSWNQPGGRLTLVNSTPVMTSNATAIQSIFYVPYQHSFVPIYNGSTVQMYNFVGALSSSTGLTLAMSGASNFPTGSVFDLYATLISGVPALVAVVWTNTTTRATTLSVFGGFLTNSGSCTAQTGPSTSETMAQNQGTWLGSIYTSAQGQSQWIFGGSGSGGVAGFFALYNYYNRVQFISASVDSGTSYTYSTATVREARGGTGMQCTILQGSSENAVEAFHLTNMQYAAVLGASPTTGIGLQTNAFNTFQFFTNAVAQGDDLSHNTNLRVSYTGAQAIYGLEEGDGSNANTFNSSGKNNLNVMAWL